ncbi:MAG: Rab family GTPase [Promethearchaeota archaeon]
MPILNKKKILVLGLEKSGKTSIMLNFIGKFNLSDYNSYNNIKSPSIVKLESGNTEFDIWDFKGEEVYRNEFLNNFDDCINGTGEIFFVIDIQDLNRYDLVIKYLREIINKLKSLSLRVDFTFFLHKYDHDLLKRFPNINNEMIENLITKIKQIVPKEDFHEIYKTTIYTILDRIHVY